MTLRIKLVVFILLSFVFCTKSIAAENLKGEKRTFLDAMIYGWGKGLSIFYQNAGFSPKKISKILTPTMDLLMHVAQMENRPAIKRQTEISATKEGMLERALKYINHSIYPLFLEAPQGLAVAPFEKWKMKLMERVRDGARTVWEHGKTLSS